MRSLRNNIVFLLLEEQERHSGAARVPLAPAGHAVLSHAAFAAARCALRVGRAGAAVLVAHPAGGRASRQAAEVELELHISVYCGLVGRVESGRPRWLARKKGDRKQMRFD